MRDERLKIYDKVADNLTDVVDKPQKETDKPDNGGWVRIKVVMLILYSALSKYNGASQISFQIALALFNGIMKSKYNGMDANNKPNESRRIYNDKILDEKDILRELYPSKYNIDGTDIDNDISNLRKKLWELHDLNIFYRFLYNDTSVFFMERLFICWKTYNPEGCVVPRTIKKIIALRIDVVNRVIVFEKAKGRHAPRHSVEEAYMRFLMGMLGKMSHTVSPLLVRWSKGMDISMYLVDLGKQLGTMDDMEGLTYSDDFMLRLPATVRKKMEDRIMNMPLKNIADMEKDLVPDQQNSVSVTKKLSKSKRGKNKNKNIINIEDLGPELGNFKDDSKIIRPFSSASQFYKFYMAEIKIYIRANEMGLYPKFSPYNSECGVATEIMDMLRENNKEEISFLSAWINSYCRIHLKGKKSQNIDHTSLRKFKKTFEDFSRSYYIPQ